MTLAMGYWGAAIAAAAEARAAAEEANRVAAGLAPAPRPCAFCQDRQGMARCQCAEPCESVPDCWAHPHRGWLGMPGGMRAQYGMPQFAYDPTSEGAVDG